MGSTKASSTIRPPCVEWNVRDLMNHIVGTNYFFAGAISGQQPDSTHDADQKEVLGDDPAAAYRASRDVAAAAFGAPGVLDKVVTLDENELPGTAVFGIAVSEAVLHGWDLAKATGQDTKLDPELAETVYNMVAPTADNGRESGAYGPAVLLGDEASTQDRLLAIVGRNP